MYVLCYEVEPWLFCVLLDEDDLRRGDWLTHGSCWHGEHSKLNTDESSERERRRIGELRVTGSTDSRLLTSSYN